MVSFKNPEIVVFAGPNGSVKSTLTALLKPKMAYVNADDIQASLHCSDLEAAVLAEHQREEFLAKRADFCFETVLSTERNLKLLKKAKQFGYFVKCYYVLTHSSAINILRVRSRIADGGHPVPEDKIIARFNRAIALIPKIIAISDIFHMYDNSGATLFRIFKKKKNLFLCDTNEFWSLAAIAQITEIMSLEQRNLNLIH